MAAASALTVAVLLVAAPAGAQEASEAEIDALVDATATAAGALAAARRLEGEGDAIGAAATIERALYTASPSEARPLALYRIALLCRLGDTTTARAELERVGGTTIGNAEWREIRASCRGFRRPAGGLARSGEGLSGQLSAGLAYDSDLSGALLAQFDIPGVPTPSDGGFSFIGSGWLGGRAALGGGAFVYGAGSAVTRNGLSGPPVDYQTGDARLGLGVQTGATALSAGGVLRGALVSGDRFVAELGGEAEVAIAAGKGRIVLHGEGVKQDYGAILPGGAVDATRWDASLGYQSSGFLVTGAYERRTSASPATDYAGFRAYAASRIELNSGSYISNAGSVRFLEYEGAPGLPGVKEQRFYGRTAYGLPLGDTGLTLEAAGTVTVRGYDAASGLAAYRDFGGELRLVWNFGN